MISVESVVPFFVAFPLCAAFAITVFGRSWSRLPDVLVFAVTTFLFSLAIISLWIVNSYGSLIINTGLAKSPAGVTMVLDGLAAFMLVTVNLVSSLVFLYATDYMDRYTSKWKFCSLFLVMLAGMNGVIIAGDIFNLYLSLEMAALASFSLVAFGVEKHQFEAAFKYAVISILGSLFIFLGIALLYGITFSLNMADISRHLVMQKENPLLVLVCIFFLMGFGIKSAMVPFHAWLPDAHPSAPAPVSAMLSGVVIKSLGIYVLSRLFFNVTGMHSMVSPVFMVLGAASMVLGGLLALGQNDIKRLMAYSSISQMGYIIVGLGIGTPLSLFAALFHLFNHSIFKSLLFLNAGAIEYATGTRDMSRLGGLMKRMPVTGLTNLVGALSISGIPPFSGFWSKLLIIIAAVMAGKVGLAFVAVLSSILTMGAFMKVVRFSFWGEMNDLTVKVKEVPVMMRTSLLVLMIICCVGGVFMFSRVSNLFITPAVRALIGVEYSSYSNVD